MERNECDFVDSSHYFEPNDHNYKEVSLTTKLYIIIKFIYFNLQLWVYPPAAYCDGWRWPKGDISKANNTALF